MAVGCCLPRPMKAQHQSRQRRNWKRQPFASKKPYTRTITPRADDTGVAFVANGDGPRDPGAACCGPATMASTGKMPGFRVICKVRRGWWQQIAPIPICCSPQRARQYFRSDDGGESWEALPRRLTETRALAWIRSNNQASWWS